MGRIVGGNFPLKLPHLGWGAVPENRWSKPNPGKLFSARCRPNRKAYPLRNSTLGSNRIDLSSSNRISAVCACRFLAASTSRCRRSCSSSRWRASSASVTFGTASPPAARRWRAATVRASDSRHGGQPPRRASRRPPRGGTPSATWGPPPPASRPPRGPDASPAPSPLDPAAERVSWPRPCPLAGAAAIAVAWCLLAAAPPSGSRGPGPAFGTRCRHGGHLRQQQPWQKLLLPAVADRGRRGQAREQGGGS